MSPAVESRMSGWAAVPGKLMLILGTALMLVVLRLPWVRFGVFRVSVLDAYYLYANMAYILAALSVGLAIRGRTELLSRLGFWMASGTLAIMAIAATHAILRSDMLISSSGGFFHNKVTPDWGPFVAAVGVPLTSIGLWLVVRNESADR